MKLADTNTPCLQKAVRWLLNLGLVCAIALLGLAVFRLLLPQPDLMPGPMEESLRTSGLPLMTPPLTGGSPARVSPRPHHSERPEPPGAIPSERVLVFADEELFLAAEQRLRQAGVRIIGRLPELNALRIHLGGGMQNALAEWADEEDFNLIVRMPTPAIPDLASTGYRPFEGNWLDALGMSSAGLAGNRGTGVTIAVLDSGLFPHSDLDPDLIQWLDLVDGSAEWLDPLGHGTAVLGLIGSGSSFAPGLSVDARILAIRVLNENGSGNSFTLAEGLVAAVDAGAAIINLSLGASGPSRILQNAIQYALDRNVVVVAAAGNDGKQGVAFPAAYPGVIGVTAVDADRNRAGFANYGEGIDLAAPGIGLYGLSNDDGFVQFDGTSAATPIVAASIAWIMSENPDLTGPQAAGLLKTKADDSGPPGVDPLVGHGLVNLGRIERRQGPDFFDLAVADVYPDTRYASSGSLPILVSIENRGNTSSAGAILEVNLNGELLSFYFGRMEIDTVMHAQLTASVHLTRSDYGVQVVARVRPLDRAVDDNPANDSIGMKFRSGPEK